MLPDFLSLKVALMNRLTGSMRRAVEAEGVLSMVSSFVAHEGDGFVTAREDGSEDASDYRRFEHGVAVSPHDVELRGADAVRELMMEMQEALARSQHEALFEELDRVTREVGTAVDAGGAPFTAELWVDAIERMEFSFDPDGKWEPPTLVIHPNQRDRVAKELSRLDSDDALAERLDHVIQQKRQDWRDREARRRLVD